MAWEHPSDKRRREAEASLQSSEVVPPAPAAPAPNAMCSICLEELSEGEFGTTVCGHQFHSACLATWMLRDVRHTCPECRTTIEAASRSRMFVTPELQPRREGKRMPRFHGG